MNYGTTTLKILAGTLSIKKTVIKTINHYPGTDISDTSYLGRPATRIKCTIVVQNDTARIALEQLMNSETIEELTFITRYYKDVVPGLVNNARLKTPDELVWYIDVEFIALKPVPYSVLTDEVIY